MSGQADLDVRPGAVLGLQAHVAAELADLGPHGVHADTATGHVARVLGGGEARREDELRGAGGVDGGRVAGLDEAALDGLAGHARGVDAAPVVADVDHDPASGLARGDGEAPARRLARGDALLRRLEAVVEGVADEVHERVADGVDDGPVQLGLLADELEVDLLVQARREVADEPREAQQHGLDRDHPDAHHELLQRVRAACQLGHRLPEPGHAGLRDERLDVGALDDELAHGVQEVVESRGGDADRSRRRLRLRGRCVAGRRIDARRLRDDDPGVRDVGHRADGGEQRVGVVGPDPDLDRASREAVDRLRVGLGALQRAVLGRLAEHHERPDGRHLGVLGQADDDVHGAGGRRPRARAHAGGRRARAGSRPSPSPASMRSTDSSSASMHAMRTSTASRPRPSRRRRSSSKTSSIACVSSATAS